ncbi:MAG: acyl-CoA thioesterase [Rhodanobacteraceae bacterium]
MNDIKQHIPTVDRFVHCYHEHVRWGDLDSFGHVNNVQFFRYLESGRIAYVRAMVDGPVGAQGESPILADQRCSYLRQITWPGDLDVYTRTVALGRSSFHLEQIVRRVGDGEIVALGNGVVVWFDFNAQRAAPIPEALRRRVLAYERVRPEDARARRTGT